MQTINIHTDNNTQIDAIKAFMKALKIKFEVLKQTESPYNKEFVAKILESKKQFKKGQFKVIKTEDLWK